MNQYGCYEITIPYSCRYKIMNEWCRENCEDIFGFLMDIWYFTNRDDAVRFALTWG